MNECFDASVLTGNGGWRVAAAGLHITISKRISTSGLGRENCLNFVTNRNFHGSPPPFQIYTAPNSHRNPTAEGIKLCQHFKFYCRPYRGLNSTKSLHYIFSISK